MCWDWCVDIESGKEVDGLGWGWEVFFLMYGIGEWWLVVLDLVFENSVDVEVIICKNDSYMFFWFLFVGKEFVWKGVWVSVIVFFFDV